MFDLDTASQSIPTVLTLANFRLKQNVLHQKWDLTDGTVMTIKDREQTYDEALLSSINWRKFPIAFDSRASESREGIVCLAGSSVECFDASSISPTGEVPGSWDMETCNQQLQFLKSHLKKSNDDSELGIHIVRMQLSLSARVVAFLGGFTAMDNEGGTLPIIYRGQFLSILTFDVEPKLVWGWAAPNTIADVNGRLDCFAINPGKVKTQLAFSTIESDKGGLFLVDYHVNDAQPVRLSGEYIPGVHRRRGSWTDYFDCV